MKLIIQMLVATCMAGTFCQKIVFDKSTFTSPCTSGARGGIDKFRITGTIGENISMLLQQNWKPAVCIQKLGRTASQFIPICELLLQDAKCTPPSYSECECFYNTTTDQAQFTISGTVHTDDQGGIVNAVWQHGNGTNIYSNKNYTFQDIYDINTAHLALTIYGVAGTLETPVPCNFSLRLNRSNHLHVCCSKMAMPCYPELALGGTDLANNGSPCVNYTPTSDGATGYLLLSYAVCSKTGYAPSRICTVKKEDVTYMARISSPAAETEDVTTYMARTSSPAVETDPSSLQDNNIPIILTLSAIIPLVVAAVAVGIYSKLSQGKVHGANGH